MLGTSETWRHRKGTACSLQKKRRTQNSIQFCQSEAKWEKVLPDISAGKLQKFAQLRDSDLRPHFSRQENARKTQPRKS